MVKYQQNKMIKNPSQTFITIKHVVLISLLVSAITFIGVAYFGVGHHRSLFQISIASLSILSMVFFLFITIGLYHGVQLKKLVAISDSSSGESRNRISDHVGNAIGSGDFLPPLADGIVGIIYWLIVTAIIIIVVLFFFEFVLPLFAGMLYWIFFRALRLIFKKSRECQGHLLKSTAYGITYTIFYSTWIYLIILTTHYLALHWVK